MLIGGLIGVVILVAVVAAVVVRSRTQDDEHSVQHYHRQLHTLEEMQAHPSTDRSNASGNGTNGTGGTEGADGANAANAGSASYPARAFKVSGSSTVRLTEPGHQIVPPVPPPPVPNPDRPVSFGDHVDTDKEVGDAGSDDDKAATFMTGTDDRAMHGINHRPRRLAGPALAVAAVLVLIVVLIVTGLHTSSPSHHGKSANTATTTQTHPRTATRHRAATTTTTTAPPSVSTAQAATAHTATYQVSTANYALALSANGGDCWVEVTSPTGSVLFTATLFPGQSHTITATGPVTVIAGAPGSFAATVNGAAVALPAGNQAPFTLHFQSAAPAT